MVGMALQGTWAFWQLYQHVDIFRASLRPFVRVASQAIDAVTGRLTKRLDTLTKLLTRQYMHWLKPLEVLVYRTVPPSIMRRGRLLLRPLRASLEPLIRAAAVASAALWAALAPILRAAATRWSQAGRWFETHIGSARVQRLASLFGRKAALGIPPRPPLPYAQVCVCARGGRSGRAVAVGALTARLGVAGRDSLGRIAGQNLGMLHRSIRTLSKRLAFADSFSLSGLLRSRSSDALCAPALFSRTRIPGGRGAETSARR